ncbi:gliding motility-associated C-terminal domain-containing protein [Flexibacter flexilis DSM 6793]|uniref:Gliding motility-associated C-terminal domain-containing protein n=2 Tax=Flexibacter flexilis TaxID=998 RepID=A0A1I1GWP9_9BACT|nr:gliding motility-associated C-terminal domain-containing protein [Flexibacter flexilis DSM 6793]
MLLFVCLLAYSQAMASHIVGGEITYKYLGQLGSSATPFRYKIDLTVYVDRNSQFPNGNPETGNIFVGVYAANSCNLYKTLTMTPNPVDVLPEMPPNCNADACLGSVAISVNKMTATVDLAFNMAGYYIYWQRCCRNSSIDNLQNAGNEGSTFLAYIPSAIFPNSSPEFVESGIPFILTGDTTTFSNNAIDPDGDRLIYSFVNPYNGALSGQPSPFGQGAPPACPSYNSINFNAGYTLTRPFGPNSYAFIDPATGFTKYYVPNAGRYVVTLEIKEYRTLSDGTDTLLTRTRRELQFIAKTAGVAGCPVNAAPVFRSITNTTPTYTYNIYEGQAVNFVIRATDTATDSLYLSAKSSILNGTNGYTGPLATFTNVKGIGDVSSTFSWQPNCGQTGSFAINATVSDRNCPPKTSSAIYTINVLPFDAPPRIFGPDTVCSTSSIGTYYVQTTSPDNQFTWKITGGTLLSNIHNDTIKVQWNGSNTNGFLTLVQKSSSGCQDSVSTKVYARAFQTLVAKIPSVNAKSISICAGQSVGLSATGSTTGYRWSPSTGLSSTTSATPTASPTVTTRYIVTVGTGSTINCWKTDTVTVNIVPKVADAGPATASICSGDSLSVGVTAVSGYTYAWLPITGVNNTTKSNPKIKIVNTGTSSQVIKYYVTATHTATGCTSRDSISVTVAPAPVAVAGTDKSFCVTGSVQIGAASQTGFTYLWSPSTGLSSTTVSNPTATLTNTGTSPITQQYILKVTTGSTGTCAGFDTVLVTVNPRPVALVGSNQSVCLGATAVLGGIANPSYTYAWSPKAGLDDSTKANPVFTGTAVGVKTYTLTVTDNTTQCVSNTATVTITVNAATNAVAGVDKTICSGITTQIGAVSQTGFSYAWSPSIGLSSATVSNPVVTLSNTGTSSITQQYILQTTNTATGCVGRDTVVVTVNPLPVAVAGADKTICSNGSVQIGAASQTGFSYAWTPSTGLSSATVSNPTVTLTNTSTSAITQQYILQVTNTTTNCISKDTVLVKVNPLPVAAAGTDKAVCVGSTVVLGGAANPNFTYAWSPKAGLDDSTKANPVFTGSAVGVKTYTLIVKDNTTQCVSNAADTVLVTVNLLPTAIAGADKTICSGGTTQIGANSQGAGFGYAWTPSTGLSGSALSNPMVTLTNTGTSAITQQYILQITNMATNCVSRDTVVVTVNPRPVALVGNPQNVCINSTAVLGGTPDASLTYAWSPKAGLDDSTKANPVFTPSVVGAVTYTLVVTNNTTNCVSVPVSITHQVKPLPVAVAGADKVVCSVQNTSLGAAPVAGLTYAWSPKVGLNDSTLANPIFNMAYAGTDSLIKTYVLTVTDGFSCQKTDTVNVVVKPLPIVVVGTNDAFCGSDTFELGAPPVQGFSYAWSPSTGLSNANIANPTLTLSNNTQTDQVHDYVLTVTNIKTGCSNKDTISVRVNPLPIVNLGTNDSLCSGQTITLGAAAEAGFIYAWSPKVGLNDSTLANPTLTLTNPTQAVQTHDYVLTVINNVTGCESKDTLTVRVNPLPIVNVGVNDSLCSGGNIVLGAAAVTGYSYAWSPATGLSNATAANPTLTLTNATQTVETHDYILTVTNNVTGCESKDTLTVRVNPLPIVNLGVNDSLCSEQTITLGAAAVTGYSYAWSPATGLSNATAANPTLTLTNPAQTAQTHDYVLTVTNNVTGCESKDTLTVRVNPLPLVNLGANDSLCSGQTITLGAAAVAGFSYAWSPKVGLSDSTLANPTLTLTNPTQAIQTHDYVLTVTNNVTGCVDNDTLTIRVNPLPIANAGTDKAICSDDNTTVGVAALANVTYTWTTNGQGTLSAANVAMPTYTAANLTQQVRVDTLYLLVQAQPTGCVSTDTVLVTVNPRPLPQTILYATTWVCPNSDAVYKIVPTDPTDTYLWTVVGGSINGANTGTAIQVTWGGANPAAKVYVRATNQYGCAGGLDSITISINPQLHPVTPAGADTLCSFDAANQTYQTGAFANAASLYTFGVQHPDGSQVSFPSQLGNNQITVNWQGLGIGKVWVRENITTSTTVCEGVSDTLYVLLQPSPDSTLLVNGSSFLCEQTLSSAYNLAGANNGSSFVWTITPSAGATFDGSTNNDSVRVNWLAAGTYVLSVQEISAAGCVGKLIDTTITVNPLPNTQLLTYDTLICPTTLGGRVYAVSGLAGSKYQWTITGGSFAGTDTTSSTAVINWSESASNYALSVVEISAAGCTLTAPLNVPLYADKSSVILTQVSGSETDATAIELLFAVNNPQTYPQDGKITVQRRKKSGNGSWTNLAELPYTATSYTDFPAEPDTTIYEYRVVGENRCGAELASAVQNNIVLKAWALETERLSQLAWNQYVGWPNGVLRYEIYRKAGETATTFDLYDQKDDGGLAWERKNASDAFTQCYRIKAISPDGAFSWSNSVCISFENKLVIANVITPNNDGKNDKWVIGNIDLYPDSDVKIFNRWGKEVYKTKGYDNSWDGEDLPVGVYFYEVSSDQKGVKARGWLEILR